MVRSKTVVQEAISQTENVQSVYNKMEDLREGRQQEWPEGKRQKPEEKDKMLLFQTSECDVKCPQLLEVKNNDATSDPETEKHRVPAN
jgi:hypothetical protein